MSAPTADDQPDADGAGSWAMESLPMAVRKELLERELRKLGFRRADPRGPTMQQQQQQQGHGSHPQAGSDAGEHGD